MSARVLNPVMMTEMGRNLGGGRPVPSRAALARVRRDLFGPVDHAAARALAERELRAQSILDAERWGFNFHLEIPIASSRYEWEIVTANDVVPEPYALRGMPYLRKHAPGTPRKTRSSLSPSTRLVHKDSSTTAPPVLPDKTERTPPQEPRVPVIGETTLPNDLFELDGRKKYVVEPTTPVLPISARKQSSITDFLKSRKRGLTGSTKSMIEPPEKISRNAGQIRS